MSKVFSKQSLYEVFNNDGKLDVRTHKAKQDAKITKSIKMISSTLIDKSVGNSDEKEELEENLRFDKMLDGIYRVHLGPKDEDGYKDFKKRQYYIKIKGQEIEVQRSEYPKELSGKVRPFSDDIYRNNEVRIPESDWLKLLNFYIIENPSLKGNKRITAQYYNIKEVWGDNCWQKGDTLKTQLIKTIPNYEDSVRYVGSIKEMKRPLEELKLEKEEIIAKLEESKICIVDVCSNIFLSIFRHIRNGLAHGRFKFYKSKENHYIFIEDVDTDFVSARMMLKVSTLLDWIDIIKGPKN